MINFSRAPMTIGQAYLLDICTNKPSTTTFTDLMVSRLESHTMKDELLALPMDLFSRTIQDMFDAMPKGDNDSPPPNIPDAFWK